MISKTELLPASVGTSENSRPVDGGVQVQCVRYFYCVDTSIALVDGLSVLIYLKRLNIHFIASKIDRPLASLVFARSRISQSDLLFQLLWTGGHPCSSDFWRHRKFVNPG